MAGKKVTAKDLVERLRNKFSSENGYVLFEQVRNFTGFGHHQSYLDVAIFSTWPSVGLTRSAFEIKVDRSDFLSELQKPEKNQWARDSFHYFWYVSPPNVIKEAELPEGCGWLKVHGDGLSIVRHAPKKESPLMNDALLSSFMRSAAKDVTGADARQKKQILTQSYEYQTALKWQSGVERFLRERKQHLYCPKTSDIVYQALLQATPDEEAQATRQQVTEVLKTFRVRMKELFDLFVMLAHYSMLETNEAGDFIVGAYGGTNEFTLDGLNKLKKSGTANDSYSKKQYTQMSAFLECLEHLSDSLLAEPPEKETK